MDKILSDEMTEKFVVAHMEALQRREQKTASECDMEYLEAIDETAEMFEMPDAAGFDWRKLGDLPDEAQQLLIWFGVGFFGTDEEFDALDHPDLPAARAILMEVREKYALSDHTGEEQTARAS